MNHRKCQKSHSGIGSSHQGLGQARILARCLYKKKTPLGGSGPTGMDFQGGVFYLIKMLFNKKVIQLFFG